MEIGVSAERGHPDLPEVEWMLGGPARCSGRPLQPVPIDQEAVSRVAPPCDRSLDRRYDSRADRSEPEPGRFVGTTHPRRGAALG